MTTELIIFKFPTLTGADEVSNVLKTLQTQHFVEVQDAIVATKYDDQHVDVRQTLGKEPGPGTAVGALTGAAAGAPAGPVGAAVGLVAGALIGRGVDAAHEPEWKVEELKTLTTYELRSGESALLVYTDTLWIGPIEQAARDFDANVYRRSNVAEPGKAYVEGMVIRTQTLDATYASWEETLERRRAEMTRLRERAKAAVQAEQTAIQQRIEKAKTELQQFYQNMLHTLDAWQQQIKADISRLEMDVKLARAQAKSELEQRLTAARESQAALRGKVSATLTARIADLKGDIENLRTQAAAQRSEIQTKWNERLDQLEAERQAEVQRLAQLDQAQDAAWAEMSNSVRQAVDTYEEKVRQAEDEFRKGA
jgi:uncharacterized membrane protein/predicted Holliday junction resolvase-like endonuclease